MHEENPTRPARPALPHLRSLRGFAARLWTSTEDCARPVGARRFHSSPPSSQSLAASPAPAPQCGCQAGEVRAGPLAAGPRLARRCRRWTPWRWPALRHVMPSSQHRNLLLALLSCMLATRLAISSSQHPPPAAAPLLPRLARRHGHEQQPAGGQPVWHSHSVELHAPAPVCGGAPGRGLHVVGRFWLGRSHGETAGTRCKAARSRSRRSCPPRQLRASGSRSRLQRRVPRKRRVAAPVPAPSCRSATLHSIPPYCSTARSCWARC